MKMSDQLALKYEVLIALRNNNYDFDKLFKEEKFSRDFVAFLHTPTGRRWVDEPEGEKYKEWLLT